MAGVLSNGPREEVSDLLGRLNLTAEEDVIVDSDDEVEMEVATVRDKVSSCNKIATRRRLAGS